jgi:hypothetical protein
MRFLRFGPQGKQILANLPMMKASFDDVAHQAVEILNRRGLIDERFFMQLRSERPNRIADIEQVERIWSMSFTPSFPKTIVAKKSYLTGAMNDGECSDAEKKITTHDDLHNDRFVEECSLAIAIRTPVGSRGFRLILNLSNERR